MKVAERLDDTALRGAAMAGLALIRFNAGKPGALRLAEQARELVPTDGSRPAADAGFSLAHILVWSSYLDRARALLESLYREWSESDDAWPPMPCGISRSSSFGPASLALAGDYAERARDLTGQYARAEAESPTNLFPLALVAAHRGDLELAREFAEQICRLAEVHATTLCAPAAMLGIVDLWSGDSEAAVAGLRSRRADRGRRRGRWIRSEHVLVARGPGRGTARAGPRRRRRRADSIAGRQAGRRHRREWVLAHATRCRGLVAAARGEIDEAYVDARRSSHTARGSR